MSDTARPGAFGAVVARCCPDLADSELMAADDLAVGELPADFDARAIARVGRGVVIWLVPRRSAATSENGAAMSPLPGMDQAVLRVPGGRYIVDVHDAETGSIISRESAAGSPVVIGLPRRGGQLLVRIEPIE